MVGVAVIRAALAALVPVCVGAWAAGCKSKDDGATVAGRTRSVSEVAAVATLTGSLELARVTDQAGGAGESSLVAALQAPPDTRSVSLRTPVAGAAEVPLEARGGGRFELAVRGEPAQEQRFPPGTYALLAVLADGSLPTLSLDARAAPPAGPVIASPADQALVPLTPLVSWTWEGSGGRFELSIREASGLTLVHEVRDLLATEYQVPDGLLAPGTRYRLEVAAVSARTGAPVRLVAATRIAFDTEAGQ